MLSFSLATVYMLVTGEYFFLSTDYFLLPDSKFMYIEKGQDITLLLH